MKSLVLLLLLIPFQGEEPSKPTFTKDIAPIVFGNCTSCHRAGEAGPFPLVSYADIKKRAKQIWTSVESRQMPPWKPEEGHGDFVGKRAMKQEDISRLKRWVEGGAVEGDPKDLPAMPNYPEGWIHGQPDLIVEMPEAFTVPAEGRDVLRLFSIPLNLTKTRYVRAVQYRPLNNRVVHHALVFLDITGETRKRDQEDPEPGFSGERLDVSWVSGGSLGSWTPGAVSQPYPDDTGMEIRKNADVLLQIHFKPSGKTEQEKSRIGIWFTQETPRRRIIGVPFSNHNIDLPSGQKDIKHEYSFVMPVDAALVGITPHAHYLGKECKVWAITPEGTQIPLIWIRDWDFQWQEQYRYRQSILLPKGTELRMDWIYDNTASNPRQPSNPPRRVLFGQRTDDEMGVIGASFVTNPFDDLKLAFAVLASRMKK